MKRSQNGFTLVELLIALGVMAVFSLLAYRGLDSVMRLHQGASAHEQQAQAIDRGITQLEADLRQAVKVTLIAPLQDGQPRLQVQRRIEGDAGNELALVEWTFDASSLQRRTTLRSGVQVATLLTQVTQPAWLIVNSGALSDIDFWRVASMAELTAQPNQLLAVPRGLGLRLSVAGKSLEKVFLVGR